MKWAHLRAFVWLRWRLMANQWRRSGVMNGVLIGVLTIGVLLLAVPLFIGALFIGWNTIPEASPKQLMYVWDGLVVAFLFFWCIGVVTELQRSEPMLLSRFLHLPVSVKEAFLINYLSSLVRLSLILFLAPAMGFAMALVGVKGVAMLPVLALLAAFALMVTALTYQLQGFLAALMTNPRRRRSVIAAATVILVLVIQVPNLMNSYLQSRRPPGADEKLSQELEKLSRVQPANRREAQELIRRQQEIINQAQIAVFQAQQHQTDKFEETARLMNMVLPIGWLPYGAMAAAEGRYTPWILGLLGMTLLGAASLGRAYRKTIQQFQGASSRRPIPTLEPAAIKTKTTRGTGVLFLERTLPGCSEPVSAIATAGMRSLARSPEVKLMLLGPLFMILIFGSMFMRRQAMSEVFRPMAAVTALAFMMLSVLQTMGNQFGLDREGFRLFVLSPARRRDILLGKNLVYTPLALATTAIVLLFFQAFNALRVDQFLAMLPLALSMFMFFCMFMNLISILTPLRIETGSLKPSNVKVGVAFAQFGLFIVLVLLILGLTLAPFLLELLLKFTGGTWGLPIGLLASIVECAVVAASYRFMLGWQGTMLQDREQRILEIVTNRGS